MYFYSGGWDDSNNALSDILEYYPKTEEWTQVGTMREARGSHAVSVVDFGDYAGWCVPKISKDEIQRAISGSMMGSQPLESTIFVLLSIALIG